MIEIKREGHESVKIFAETIEYEAIEQIKKLSTYPPYLDNRIRIMPDCHAGAGCTIGTTMKLDGKVTANLVGVDQNCGMLAVQLDPKSHRHGIELEKLDKVIHEHIPAGFEIHSEVKYKCDFLDDLRCGKHCDLRRSARSIGTLGGGEELLPG